MQGLEYFARIKEVARLEMFFSAGALTFTAAFIQDAPAIPGLKYVINLGLQCFLLSFLASFITVMLAVTFETSKGGEVLFDRVAYALMRVMFFIGSLLFLGGILVMYYFTGLIISFWP